MLKLSRRDVIVAAVAVSATVAVGAFAQTPAKPVMRSSVFQWNDLKAEPSKTGSRRGVFDTRTATLERLESHVTTLAAGQSPHPAHRHPEEELVIVREGTLEALQGERTTRVNAGGMIFQASNELHGLKNVGTTPAVYYVVKWASAATPATR